jgi:hypothetical protein
MLDVTKNTGRTPQDIMIAKSAEIGANIASQGTTRVIFDTAPAVPAGGMMRFFNQNRAFPDTNFKDQFESGESLLITHLVFAFPNNSESPFSYGNLDIRESFGRTAYFEIKIGNSRVLQQTKLDFVPTYPTTEDNDGRYWLPLESGLFIPPQVDFEVNLYLPDGSGEKIIACYIVGVGSLLNIKNY